MNTPDPDCAAPVSPRLWAVVPAAGCGRRFGGELPKQYQRLGGLAVLEHSLHGLLAVRHLRKIAVALAAEDEYWRRLAVFGDPRLMTASGGAARADSVLSGLRALSGAGAAEDDWVLVHDAVRPCVAESDIHRLLEAVADHSVGGLLALPVADTLKRGGPRGAVAATVDRRNLWAAQTPQVFRLGLLRAALEAARRDGETVTDEASAMEAAGHHPLLVHGSPRNVKITYRDDLDIARLFLESR